MIKKNKRTGFFKKNEMSIEHVLKHDEETYHNKRQRTTNKLKNK